MHVFFISGTCSLVREGIAPAQRRQFRMVLALCVPLVLSGCGAGVGALAGFLSSDDDGGNPAPANLDPLTPTNVETTRTDGETVALDYDLFDADGGPLSVTIEWREDRGGPPKWRRVSGENGRIGATGAYLEPPLPLIDGRQTVTVPAKASTRFRCSWSACADIRASLSGPTGAEVEAAAVVVRITVLEEETHSAAFESKPFYAGNEKPRILALDIADLLQGEQGTARRSGNIRLRCTISDSTDDHVALGLAATFEEAVGTPVTKPLTLVGAPAMYDTTRRGVEYVLVWDSNLDIPGRTTAVAIEVTPIDQFNARGDPFLCDLVVDNNDDPIVQIVDIASSSDRSFEIPVRVLVRDEEEHPVSLILQWTLDGEPFPALPRSADCPGCSIDDLDFLFELLASPEPEFAALRRDLRIVSEAPRRVRGIVEGIEPSRNGVRATDLVRSGLVVRPPGQDRPRDLPACGARKDTAPCTFGPQDGVLLVGQAIEFLEPAGAVNAPPPVVGKARIASFQPADAVAVLDERTGRTPEAGMAYEIAARSGFRELESSVGGVLHTVLWDSFGDLTSAGIDLSARVRLRAIGVDSEVGFPSFETTFDLESGFLLEEQSWQIEPLQAEPSGQQSAVGDIDGDGRVDLVIGSPQSPRLQLHRQRDSGVFPTAPNPVCDTSAYGNPRLVAIGDVSGDGNNDVAVVLNVARTSEDSLAVYVQDPRPGYTIGETPGQVIQTGAGIVALALADLIGDAGVDLAIAADPLGSTIKHAVMIYRNDGGVLGTSPSVTLELPENLTSLLAGDIDGDGTADLAAGSWNELLRSSAVHVFFGRTGASFERRDMLNPGAGPPTLARGRLLGRDALVVATRDANRITIFSGDLVERASLTSEGAPLLVATGDFNTDGVGDVLVGTEPGALNVHLGAADGTLPPAPSFALKFGASFQPRSLAVGDVTSDRRDDVVLLGDDSSYTSLAKVFAQSYFGSLSFSRPRFLEAGRRPVSIATGDLNGDGRNDVVVANFGDDAEPDASLGIYRQTSHGTLPSVATQVIPTAPINVPTTESGFGIVAIGDTNGDGRSDVAVANYQAGRVSVYAGRTASGDLDPAPTFTFADGQDPRAVEIGDANADGRNDILVAYAGSRILSVYYQDEKGTFPRRADLEAGTVSSSISVGDLDGDGRNEVVLTNAFPAEVRIFNQDAARTLSLGAMISYESENERIRCAIIADMTGDGRKDLVIALYHTIRVYAQETAGGIGENPTNELFINSPSKLASWGDLNGDGRNDLVVTCEDFRFNIFYQDGQGRLGLLAGSRFLANQHPGGVSALSAPAVADVNGDGRDDLIGAVSGYDMLVLYLAR